MSEKPKKQNSPIQRHQSGECECSKESNPNECLYQLFLDGWDYTADAGNGQSRGEVFTPRMIVDKMIVDGNILPSNIVYKYDYKSLSKKNAHQLIIKTVYEPAVGTGNFYSTILWHKICLANIIAGNDTERYKAFLLQAVGSMYASDIDPGNLQTLWWRIIRDGSPVLHAKALAHWVDVILKRYQESVGRKCSMEELSQINKHVASSLMLAQDNWCVLETDDGLLEQLYLMHTGKQLPNELKNAINVILNHNLQLFDSLSDTHSLWVPGAQDVVWYKWWTEEGKLKKKIIE